MGLDDLAGRLYHLFAGSGEEYHVMDSHVELAEEARSDVLSPELLAKPADRTSQPPARYLDDDEQPQYVLLGSRLLIDDEAGSLARKHPTRHLVVVVSDRRILFVLGGRLSDDVLEIPFAAVRTIYVDEDYPQRHVVLEADRDGDEMTFYADVTMDPHETDVTEGVEYVQSQL